MKKIFLLVFVVPGGAGFAQIHRTLPPEATVFYDEAHRSAKPEIISFVEKKSAGLSGNSINSDSLYQSLKKESSLKNMDSENLKAINLLILIECSYKTDAELKHKVLQIHKRGKGEVDFDDTAPLLERKSKIAEQVSKWLRQIDDQTAALKNLQ